MAFPVFEVEPLNRKPLFSPRGGIGLQPSQSSSDTSAAVVAGDLP